MDGYYKPSLTEFHYGFRYEIVQEGHRLYRVYDSFMPLSEISKLLDESKIEVRKLSSDDITELGYNRVYSTAAFVNPSGITISLVDKENSVILVEVQDIVYYLGVCRNINELVNILNSTVLWKPYATE